MHLPLRAILRPVACAQLLLGAGAISAATLADGRTLHLACEGRSEVTILLEAGWAADSRLWTGLQPRLARMARTCVSDRAGAGRSSPGPMPRTAGAIAADLDEALKVEGIDGPVLLVGHSIGALHVRALAARLRPRVVGMLLVDPTSFPANVSGVIARSRACLEAPAAEGCAVRPPAEAKAAWAARLSELEHLEPPPPLPAVPVIVLAATRGLPPELVTARLAALSEPGATVRPLPDSGHMVMRDRPDAILAGVEQLLASRDSQVTPAPAAPKPEPQGERP